MDLPSEATESSLYKLTSDILMPHRVSYQYSRWVPPCLFLGSISAHLWVSKQGIPPVISVPHTHTHPCHDLMHHLLLNSKLVIKNIQFISVFCCLSLSFSLSLCFQLDLSNIYSCICCMYASICPSFHLVYSPLQR